MSQGRTATVEKVIENGALWFKKRNPSPELTDIEFRIYEALGDALVLECDIPATRKDPIDPCVLYVQDVGSSLADDLVLNPQAIENPFVLPSYLMRVVKVRAVINATINGVLTPADKKYLTQRQQASLLEATQKRASLPGMVTEKELEQHFWANFIGLLWIYINLK